MNIRKISLTIFMSCLLGSCFGPFRYQFNNPNGSSYPNIATPKKSSRKHLLQPPSSLINAVFEYKRLGHQWPYTLETSCRNKTCIDEYKRFMDQGITDLNVVYSSQDSFIVNVVFSHSKHAQNNGISKSFMPDGFLGTYIFVSDSSLKFFNVLVGKEARKYWRLGG